MYLMVDKDGQELRSNFKPYRGIFDMWAEKYDNDIEYLEKGTIEKLIGKKLAWEDEPYSLLAHILKNIFMKRCKK